MSNSNSIQPNSLVPKVDEQLPLPVFTPPILDEMITSSMTGNTYRISDGIGEGHFGVVYACTDTWDNELAAKILKPRNQPYETIKQEAIDEFLKLLAVRNPYITFVYDAFEYRHTFYIITERCYRPIRDLLNLPKYNGNIWAKPIAHCLLQAVHYIHLNGLAHQDIHLGNVFCSFIKDELIPLDNQALTFKLGDLGITKLIQQMDASNTFLAEWMRPPEAINNLEFGPLDHRIDIYHCGLLLLQVLAGKELMFSREEILSGAPRQLALTMPPPYNFALEKALRRHVLYRTATALELWRDLNVPEQKTLQIEKND
jgi:serine/threonine-protein kinase